MNSATMTSTEKRPVTQMGKRSFPVTGMICTGCAATVEGVLRNQAGVHDAAVNFAARMVSITYDPSVDKLKLREALRPAGFDLILQEENVAEGQETQREEQYQSFKKQTIWSAVLTLPVFLTGMFFIGRKSGKWICAVLSVPVLFWFGRRYFVHALRLARYLKVNRDKLIALGTGITFLYSLFNTLWPDFWLRQGIIPPVYYEVATVIVTLISFGKLLEEKARSYRPGAIKKLVGL